MNFVYVCMILSLGLFYCLISVEGTSRCITVCTRQYDPVCGILKLRNGKTIQCTFGNACVLQARRCMAKEQWTGKRGRCAANSSECSKLLRRQ